MKNIVLYSAAVFFLVLTVTTCGRPRDPAVDAWNECLSDYQLDGGGTLPKSAQDKADCLEGIREQYPTLEP